MLNNEQKPSLADQYTDRSGAVMVKIASRMADTSLAELALNTLFSMKDRPLHKEASFSTGSATDTFLSRVYFEGQREKLAAEEAKAIDDRLQLYESLYALNTKVAFKKPLQKTASAAPIELLPMCKIASEGELFQAGNDFSREYSQLSTQDRQIFAKNFIKAASELGVKEIPDAVRIYAEDGVEARPDMAEYVLLRKVAMERLGRENDYEALYATLKDEASKDLHKLAAKLDAIDEACGLRDTRSGATLPDAWHSVFRVKTAEITDAMSDAVSMDKADIVARYGSGILEEVEKDEDGSIDRDKLARIVAMLGKTTESEQEDNNPPKTV